MNPVLWLTGLTVLQSKLQKNAVCIYRLLLSRCMILHVI